MGCEWDGNGMGMRWECAGNGMGMHLVWDGYGMGVGWGWEWEWEHGWRGGCKIPLPVPYLFMNYEGSEGNSL